MINHLFKARKKIHEKQTSSSFKFLQKVATKIVARSLLVLLRLFSSQFLPQSVNRHRHCQMRPQSTSKLEVPILETIDVNFSKDPNSGQVSKLCQESKLWPRFQPNQNSTIKLNFGEFTVPELVLRIIKINISTFSCTTRLKRLFFMISNQY